MSKTDPWDWPFLLYMGTVVLKRSEKAFWRMTPRKLNALSQIHTYVNGGDPPPRKGQAPEDNKPKEVILKSGPWKGQKVGFIDQI